MSWSTSKIFISFFSAFWREILIALLTAVILWLFFITIDGLKKDVLIAKQERDQYSYAFEFQNAQIETNRAEYEEKLKKLPKTLERIKTQYVATYQLIDDFKGDNNASDCKNVVDFFSTISY